MCPLLASCLPLGPTVMVLVLYLSYWSTRLVLLVLSVWIGLHCVGRSCVGWSIVRAGLQCWLVLTAKAECGMVLAAWAGPHCVVWTSLSRLVHTVEWSTLSRLVLPV